MIVQIKTNYSNEGVKCDVCFSNERVKELTVFNCVIVMKLLTGIV